ncbi:MAG: hypothetical protein F4X84_01655 [Synechococcus sp. SB0662_bin_45]|uniref:Regulator of phycobilisome association C n=1 Tax=Synechococcus sp. SB0676_bin_10 TaxID=2604869 RepID=A0A6B1F9D7_9SYNE|nr:hypothetical protein [Cyanobacteria bacterium MAG IRC3_bin_20]MCY3654451.1 hypothetical protein [Cyanobacteria bacterium MAG IRC1_bin_28]MDE0646646.1 hypothetical protein [Cyanobacteria bacterium MAG IRC4_bin_6]MXW11950.1 hypothetical protein [Synechococcus sp. SB0668_bin_13]MXX09720.1 hypothetical protein [Synechococcus sp. SB0667_bin_8]MXY19502.1 hypothetical protein [Synechococcus sp. SB0664_bin_36]MXY62187.1 hypothetical protein [Synechococcus sp. SB0665_bin_28]MYE21103.1 hypothetical
MKPLPPHQAYQVRCTLSFGDIYGQVLLWIMVIFMSLAAAMALMGASRPLFALMAVGLVLVLSLPFLLFAFVTTLLNHVALEPLPQADTTSAAVKGQSAPQERMAAG